MIKALITWYVKDWLKDNLTESNIKKGFEGFCEWVADENIKRAIAEIIKFCLLGIIKEIQIKVNEK